LPPGTLQKLQENAFVTATAAGKLLVVPMCYHSITLEAVAATAAALEDRLLASAAAPVDKLLVSTVMVGRLLAGAVELVGKSLRRLLKLVLLTIQSKRIILRRKSSII